MKTEDNPGQMSQALQQAQVISQSGNTTERALPGGKDDQPQRTRNFSNLGSMMGMPFSRNPNGEALATLNKAMKEYVEKNYNADAGITLVPLDSKNIADLLISVLVVCIEDKKETNGAVAHHALIIDQSYEGRRTATINSQGAQVEVQYTAGDANNRQMLQVIRTELAAKFPNRRLVNAEACVVPAVFDTSKIEAVGALALNCLFAAYTELVRSRRDFVDLNLAEVSNDQSLQIEQRFGQPEITDVTGLPTRADIQMTFMTVDNQRGPNQTGLVLERNQPLARVSGFLDVVVLRDMQSQNQFYQPQQNDPVYMPRFVITKMEGEAVMTPAAQLLGIVTAVSLRQNLTWAQGFYPNAKAGADGNIHDIGGIGIELNAERNANGIGTRIDTQSPNFRPETLSRMIQAFFKPHLLISLDVNECGPDTWVNGYIAAAARGDKKANDIVIRAANQLTNGAFGKYFNDNNPVAFDECNRIQLGYYIDSNGVRRDMRNLDTLAILNLAGDRDPSVYRDWKNSFQNTKVDIDKRLAIRRKIAELLRVEMVITGHAVRSTLTDEFIGALMAGVAECGVSIRPNMGTINVSEFETAGYGYMNMMGQQPVTGYDLFNRNNGGFAQGNGSSGGFGSRY